MIKKSVMWYIICDNCGKVYVDAGEESYYLTEEEAREEIESDESWETSKGFLCPECQLKEK